MDMGKKESIEDRIAKKIASGERTAKSFRSYFDRWTEEIGGDYRFGAKADDYAVFNFPVLENDGNSSLYQEHYEQFKTKLSTMISSYTALLDGIKRVETAINEAKYAGFNGDWSVAGYGDGKFWICIVPTEAAYNLACDEYDKAMKASTIGNIDDENEADANATDAATKKAKAAYDADVKKILAAAKAPSQKPAPAQKPSAKPEGKPAEK